jgi:ABC-type multidrug transport system ATPase subunit
VRGLLAEISTERLVVFSTHIVEDIERTCHRVAILDRGGLIYLGDPEGLRTTAAGSVYTLVVPDEELAEVRRRYRLVSRRRVLSGIEVRLLADQAPSPAARLVEPTIEDAYLLLVGRRGLLGWRQAP